jgi:hypothetical protein
VLVHALNRSVDQEGGIGKVVSGRGDVWWINDHGISMCQAVYFPRER